MVRWVAQTKISKTGTFFYEIDAQVGRVPLNTVHGLMVIFLVTTNLQMGIEYDPNDIDQYKVIASYQSIIAYTQIYYLQEDGANTIQYYEDVPVHGRLK